MAGETPKPEDIIGSDLVREDVSFTQIVLEFIQGMDNRLEAMERAIRISDFEALRIAAHQLKGSGGGYGYPVLSQRAAELETHARAGLVDECMQAFSELKTVCERVVISTD